VSRARAGLILPRQVNNNDLPPPGFSINVDSNGFNVCVSDLESTLTGSRIGVDSKIVTAASKSRSARRKFSGVALRNEKAAARSCRSPEIPLCKMLAHIRWRVKYFSVLVPFGYSNGEWCVSFRLAFIRHVA
jgi:hypothetical protein